MRFVLNNVLKIIFFILFSPFGFKFLFSVDGYILSLKLENVNI
nr:MAG TPA: hypothetical protein [Bacteriophage sp.]